MGLGHWRLLACFALLSGLGVLVLFETMLWKSCAIAVSVVFRAMAAPAWSVDPINPPAIPLAVKHPYLNTWLFQGGGTALNSAWPGLWTGNSITAWTGFVRVDGKAYSWLVRSEVV